jgi:hypothetical protein
MQTHKRTETRKQARMCSASKKMFAKIGEYHVSRVDNKKQLQNLVTIYVEQHRRSPQKILQNDHKYGTTLTALQLEHHKLATTLAHCHPGNVKDTGTRL